MSQTDRQPDKATHWNTALFDEITTKDGRKITGQWELVKKLPDFVKDIRYQEEICPDTGKHHLQIHVQCHKQQRLSALTGWIKHTNWRPVTSKEHIAHSIAYTSKKETAVPGTHVHAQGEQYLQFHEILLEIAKQHDGVYSAEATSWEVLTGRLIIQDPRWANKLANPALKKSWDWWKFQFIGKVHEYCEWTSGAYIIEAPPDEVPEVCMIE